MDKIKDIIFQDIEQLAEATADMYPRLVWGLNNITGKNGWLVLVDMEYIDYIEGTVPTMYNNHICNQNLDTDALGHNIYVCACGKKGIKKLTIMKYEHKDFRYILLGACCILTMDNFLKQIQGVEDFKKKIIRWNITIKEQSRKYKYNLCFCCKNRNVSKTRVYKKEQKQYWCKDCCLTGGKIKCINCGHPRFFLRSPTTGEIMLYCSDCFYDNSIEDKTFTQHCYDCGND